ncbi:MAG: LptA/OstA family protein [Alphaproteobacteria bacterium]
MLAAAMLAAAMLAAGSCAGVAAAADFASFDSSQPISVEASHGIEWRREEGVFIARGDAKAAQGDTEIGAETLTARYRETPAGGNRIHLFEASGNVRVASGGNRLFGAEAVYDVDAALFTMSGPEVRLETPDETIVANRGMEYRNQARTAHARGDVVVVRGDRRLRADAVTAFFKDASDGGLTVERIEAKGNVLIATAKEVVRADEAVYDPDREIVELAGRVRVTRGRNELAGGRAVLDLRAGVSRIEAGGDSGRVRAVFMPGERNR